MLLDGEALIEAARYIARHVEPIRDKLIKADLPDFQFISWNKNWRECITVKEYLQSLSTFAVITGKTCSGKTTMANMLCKKFPDEYVRWPEVMTRQPRYELGEVEGRDLIYMSEGEFVRRHQNNEFFLAYWFGQGSDRKGVGILNEQMSQMVSDHRRKLLIADPYEMAFLLPELPLTRCSTIVVDQRTHDLYKQMRGVPLNRGNDQNHTGVIDDDYSFLPWGPLTQCIWNYPEETCENLLEMDRFLRANWIR